jgi:hypothetical protein
LFYALTCRNNNGSERILATAETRYLSSEVAGGFTGVYFAMYASGNGSAVSSPAHFDWFDYRDIDNTGTLGIDSTLSSLLKDNDARDIIGTYLPLLVENPPIAWQANLSLVAFSAMAPELVSPEKLLLVDSALQAKRIPDGNG